MGERLEAGKSVRSKSFVPANCKRENKTVHLMVCPGHLFTIHSCHTLVPSTLPLHVPALPTCMAHHLLAVLSGILRLQHLLPHPHARGYILDYHEPITLVSQTQWTAATYSWHCSQLCKIYCPRSMLYCMSWLILWGAAASGYHHAHLLLSRSM